MSIPRFALFHHQGPGLGCAARGDGEGPRPPCSTCVPLSPDTRGQKGDGTRARAEREPLLISRRTNTHLTPYTACSNGSGRTLLGTVARMLTKKKKKIIYIYIYNIYSTMKISMETNGAAGKYAEQQQQKKKAQNRTDSQLLPELMLSFPTSPPKPRSPRCARGAGGPPRLPPLSPQSSAPSPGSQLCPLIRLHPPRGRAPGRSQ